MATECYEGDCPLHSHDEPIGLCSDSEEVKLLCEERKRLKNRIAELEGKLAEVDDDEVPFNKMYEFHCFHCDSTVPYSPKYISIMLEHHKKGGMSWWECPVCGSKVYFEEVYNWALRRKEGKGPRVALP